MPPDIIQVINATTKKGTRFGVVRAGLLREIETEVVGEVSLHNSVPSKNEATRFPPTLEKSPKIPKAARRKPSPIKAAF